MPNDILQYAIDIRNPIDLQTIRKALENAGIDVVGIEYKASWHDEDYWNCKKPYRSC